MVSWYRIVSSAARSFKLRWHPPPPPFLNILWNILWKWNNFGLSETKLFHFHWILRNILWKWNNFGLSETKLFHFHWIFKKNEIRSAMRITKHLYIYIYMNLSRNSGCATEKSTNLMDKLMVAGTVLYWVQLQLDQNAQNFLINRVGCAP